MGSTWKWGFANGQFARSVVGNFFCKLLQDNFSKCQPRRVLRFGHENLNFLAWLYIKLFLEKQVGEFERLVKLFNLFYFYEKMRVGIIQNS